MTDKIDKRIHNGGARPGAGRPPKDGVRRVTHAVHLPPSAWMLLDALRKPGESRSDALARIIAEA